MWCASNSARLPASVQHVEQTAGDEHQPEGSDASGRYYQRLSNSRKRADYRDNSNPLNVSPYGTMNDTAFGAECEDER